MRTFYLIFFILSKSICGSSQCVNGFPYNQDFELNNGNWVSGGTANDWSWGAVSKGIIAQAASGSNCWVTGGLTASFYSYGERSYLESPCFDFSSLQHPLVSFNIYWETERTYDGAVFQYSIDGGNTWQNVGSSADAVDCLNQNWFNTSNITNLNGLAVYKEGWAGNIQPTIGNCQGGNGSNGWKTAIHCLTYLAGQPNVIFRFAFGAGTQCNNFDGFAFDDFTVNEAPLPLVDFTYTCSGNLLNFTGSFTECPNNFIWNFGDGTIGTGATVTHSYSSSGNYNVTFSAGGSCYSTTNISHTVQMLNVLTTGVDASCYGKNDGRAIVSATGGANYTYNWNTSPIQAGDTAFRLLAGNYTVTVSAPNFCDVTAAIVVNEPLLLENIFLVVADTCYKSIGSITANVTGGTPPYNFSWSAGGFNTDQINNISAGNYSVTITDGNNCSLSDGVHVPFATDIYVVPSLKENVSCLESDDGKIEIAVTGGLQPYRYFWSNGANTPSISNLTKGKYLVTVTDANNCSTQDSIVIEKEVCPSYIYFPTAFSPNGDGANETFKPKYSIDLREYFIRIFNRWGEEVYESDDVNEGWNGAYKNTIEPLGVFVWFAQYSFTDGNKHSKAGNLTLVK